jgi:hypothetical protein
MDVHALSNNEAVMEQEVQMRGWGGCHWVGAAATPLHVVDEHITPDTYPVRQLQPLVAAAAGVPGVGAGGQRRVPQLRGDVPGWGPHVLVACPPPPFPSPSSSQRTMHCAPWAT